MGSSSNTDPAGAFLEPYFWNQFLSLYADFQMILCNTQGWWGELWYNDNGEMMEACLNTGLTGAQAQFIEA